jgi:hypothetical protein
VKTGRVVVSSLGALAICTSGNAGIRIVYVSPHGADARPCTRAAPCKSFDRAYRVARPGETIQLAGGTYPAQLVRVDVSKVNASRNVVFQPAPGAKVKIAGELTMYGSHATFLGSGKPSNFRLQKLTSVATAGKTTSNHVTFVDLDGETFTIGPNYAIAIKGGDWGPSIACHARNSKTKRGSWCPAGSIYARSGNDGSNGSYENGIGPDGTIKNQWPHDILLDGLTIHDQNSVDLTDLHQGGLFIISGYGITIRNSKFLRNVVYQIQVQDFTNKACCGMSFGPLHDVVIENNWFGQPVTGLSDPGSDHTDDNQPELQLDPRGGSCWSNWLVRFNSFHNGPALGFDAEPCFDRFRMIGNIGEHPGLQCFANAKGLTWAYNAWQGGKCDATDVALTSLPYVNTTIGKEDYHLTGGPAQDLVTPTGGDYALATDIDGQPRPNGPARDAGADER